MCGQPAAIRSFCWPTLPEWVPFAVRREWDLLSRLLGEVRREWDLLSRLLGEELGWYLVDHYLSCATYQALLVPMLAPLKGESRAVN